MPLIPEPRNSIYYLPDLTLPAEETKPIGVWGQQHKRYLKEYKKAVYTTLLTSGKSNALSHGRSDYIAVQVV
ncbi:MAG: TnpV protein [Clostridiales bacterium]|nr:TnpV protein [Clostridiales bacterium]